MTGGWEVGQLAEIDWMFGAARGTTLCWWDPKAEWWRAAGPIPLGWATQGCAPHRVIDKPRLRNPLPQDAIVLPENCWGTATWDDYNWRQIAQYYPPKSAPHQVFMHIADAVDAAAPVEVPLVQEPVEHTAQHNVTSRGWCVQCKREPVGQPMAEGMADTAAWLAGLRGPESDSPVAAGLHRPTVPVDDSKAMGGQITECHGSVSIDAGSGTRTVWQTQNALQEAARLTATRQVTEAVERLRAERKTAATPGPVTPADPVSGSGGDVGCQESGDEIIECYSCGGVGCGDCDGLGVQDSSLAPELLRVKAENVRLQEMCAEVARYRAAIESAIQKIDASAEAKDAAARARRALVAVLGDGE